MAVLVGIDEAGFGPLLGPLIVSSCALSIPDSLAEADLWQVLKKSLARQRKGLRGRLLVADSKKVYNKTAGIGHLERTVLAFLRCMGRTNCPPAEGLTRSQGLSSRPGQSVRPATLADLLSLLTGAGVSHLDEYPWYAGIEGRAIPSDGAGIRIAAKVLSDDMSAQGIRVLAVRSCYLDVAAYNRMMSAVRNKSLVLFSATTELIQRAFDGFGSAGLYIVVDRQGGRSRYGAGLLRCFPGTEMRILHEDSRNSRYQLRTGKRTMDVRFVVDADEDCLPVSLASMVCKYVRELMMECLNRYFVGLRADLAPTAGYWEDGTRFLQDLRAKLGNLRIDETLLVRCR